MVDLFLEMLFIVLTVLHAAQPNLNQYPFSFFQKYSSWDQHVKIVPHLIMQLMQTTQKSVFATFGCLIHTPLSVMLLEISLILIKNPRVFNPRIV